MNIEQECIGQRCWHDFVIKDATVKQVNVTDEEKSTLSGPVPDGSPVG